ncbi:MAG: glycosyltransferase [Hyphomicrobiaceae bacterium]|nr:MAG: glycosyltransferase [Hyphomicrobiaceae bacterium]
MNIIHVLRAPIGGLFRHVVDVASAQAELGHGIGIVYDRATVTPAALERLAGLAPMARLGMLSVDMSREISFRDLTGYLEITRFAKRNKAAVLHGHGAKGGAFARLAARACRRSGLKTDAYYTPHGGSLHYDRSSLKGRVFLALEERLLPLTRGVIFESAYSARMFAEKIGRPARFTVVHNGLSPAEFVPVTPRPDAADFLFVGELRRLKGVDVLIEAVALLNRSRRTRLAIVGEGPDGCEFEELASRLGLDGLVRFHGTMPAREAFALGRTLVVPSRAESLPYIVLEAAAAGIPLIAADVGGIPEIVAQTPVRLVAPGDAEALATSLAAALDDTQSQLAAAGELKRKVADRFSLRRMCDEITEFYQTRAPQRYGLEKGRREGMSHEYR